jgi:nitronate monooxygenase
MSLQTPFSRKLGLKAPIFQAPMAGVTTPELVAAVSKAGALGGFGFAYTEPAAMKAAVDKVRAQGALPVHVNLFVETPAPAVSAEQLQAAAAAIAPAFRALNVPVPGELAPPYCPDLSAQIEAALSLKPTVLTSHFNPFPKDIVREAKKAGILVGGSATTLEEALELESGGVDFVIAQGAEAGGHRGTFTGKPEIGLVGTIALTRLIVKNVKLPVVAAGGIMDGAGIACVLALGAEIAQIGTAFIPCAESGAPAQHKTAVLEMDMAGTAITRAFSGRPARGIRNRYIEHAEASPGPILPFPAQHKLTVPLRAESNKQGTPQYVALWAGQGYPLAREGSAAELIAAWMKEADEIIAGLKQ